MIKLIKNYIIYNFSYTHSNQEQKKEHFDQPQVLENKIEQLAHLIKNSNHLIAFTGAGISTSTGIPDFRSGKNTVIPTGPGAWEKKALGINPQPKLYTPASKAKPSITHMALLTLQQKNILKYLVSQNTDGLHLRSGFPSDYLSQLHGNINLEVCKTCQSKFLRDFRTRTATQAFQHQTHRKCEKCSGKLYDTIINFGQKLSQKVLQNGLSHASRADLCLCLGSSLTVNPASQIPKYVGTKEKLVIVNLQSTPLDSLADIRINAMCDVVMQKVMKKLSLTIQGFTLKRYIQIQKCENGVVQVRGVDPLGTPYSFLKDVVSRKGSIHKYNDQQPFSIQCQSYNQSDWILDIDLVFYGHYNEPSLKIKMNLNELQEKTTLQLQYDVYQEKWIKVTPYKLYL